MQQIFDPIQLPISEITINPDVNIRELDPDHIADLADAQKDYGETEWQKHWKELPKINDENILFSGFHTITAAQRNFGDSHEIDFLVVEGNPYLLAACENAAHGKRRTNADKRAAVLRWLEDDEGKQWSDSHIAKMCHVSNQMVRAVALSLGESPTDNYQRPTLRKSINKHGDIEEVETANIGRQKIVEG